MKESQLAATIHFEYRTAADKEAQVYSDLRTMFPTREFPRHAARTWRLGMLALIWGTTATNLCGGKMDYIEEWRTGK